MSDDPRTTRRPGPLRDVLFRVGGPLCRRLFRLRVEGDEHLPAAGAAIIAANHLSFFDSVVLALAVPRRLSFVGKAEYLDSWKTRRLFPALGMIPVDREHPRRAYGALQAAAGVLEADELFAVYPEGTRSQDGSLHGGHNGVGHLSVTTGASIIPAGIVGTDRIQPRGARVPAPVPHRRRALRRADRSGRVRRQPAGTSPADHPRRDDRHQPALWPDLRRRGHPVDGSPARRHRQDPAPACTLRCRAANERGSCGRHQWTVPAGLRGRARCLRRELRARRRRRRLGRRHARR